MIWRQTKPSKPEATPKVSSDTRTTSWHWQLRPLKWKILRIANSTLKKIKGRPGSVAHGRTVASIQSMTQRSTLAPALKSPLSHSRFWCQGQILVGKTVFRDVLNFPVTIITEIATNIRPAKTKWTSPKTKTKVTQARSQTGLYQRITIQILVMKDPIWRRTCIMYGAALL